LARVAADTANECRQVFGSADTGGHGVLEVVTHIGDAVGPTDDFALGSAGCRPTPRVIANAVGGLGAEIERRERDVGAPHRVIEATRHVGRESIFAGVAARTVAAVVTECDGLGEREVES